jgi:enediyne core biosynthesis thioesterase
MRYYEYRHLIGFEETNLVGNVYYVNHLRWQGRCREMFLRDHAPSVLDDLANGLCLVTLHCSCDYLEELRALDEVIVRMRLAALNQSSFVMQFDYLRSSADGEHLIARGEQRIGCMRRNGVEMTATPVPPALAEALRPYVS